MRGSWSQSTRNTNLKGSTLQLNNTTTATHHRVGLGGVLLLVCCWCVVSVLFLCCVGVSVGVCVCRWCVVGVSTLLCLCLGGGCSFYVVVFFLFKFISVPPSLPLLNSLLLTPTHQLLVCWCVDALICVDALAQIGWKFHETVSIPPHIRWFITV
jgi:hypothetical protein